MELLNRDKRDGYAYDPIIKQYDTNFWRSTTGTPAMSSTVLRYTSAASSSYIQHEFADIEFSLNVPVAPTTSQDKVWGLRNPSSDNLGACYFQITGSTFQAVSIDDGGTSETTSITWDAGWHAAATEYRITWEADLVRFMVNGVIKATHTVRVPSNALSARIVNANADNMDLSYMAVRKAAGIV